MTNCRKNHPTCSNRRGTLPTRVIDIGNSSRVPAVLYVTKAERRPYVALSHCWGGDIPCKTTTGNLKEYQKALPINELPQNFRDAIFVTRGLGLRYLWIDALCIIQDSADDWRAQAGGMAAVYSNATITISALDSTGSTVGFLQPRPQKPVLLSCDLTRDNVVIQAMGKKSYHAFNESILNTRGWCLQERLLSPSLLHFGRDQMYWECRAIVHQEDNDFSVCDAMDCFMSVRRDFNRTATPSVDEWYSIVEEYSRRKLTNSSDTFPALAGIADRFRSAGIGGSYIAGLWEEDLELGIFWSAAFFESNEVAALGRPSEARAPSWSWASVDGDVAFQHHKQGRRRKSAFKVLQAGASLGWDDPTAPKVDGFLKLRGPMAQMSYALDPEKKPAPKGDLDPKWCVFGSLRFGENTEPITWQAIMDFDRHVSRDCWVLVTGHIKARGILLEEVEAGIFRRIGCIYISGWDTLNIQHRDFIRFAEREIVLV
ncbi:heterokaryon incompatibility protein [Colletotrichum kahawae]|uniref:Heterokaryon incompatibility protein n=1 Tax=Colletotrichum kahawae TaxID=34407 RepID=A0AAE0DH07_COLKA|nr:heterokaryon incompatibility protein [Colletotrichum kahawae]